MQPEKSRPFAVQLAGGTRLYPRSRTESRQPDELIAGELAAVMGVWADRRDKSEALFLDYALDVSGENAHWSSCIFYVQERLSIKLRLGFRNCIGETWNVFPVQRPCLR